MVKRDDLRTPSLKTEINFVKHYLTLTPAAGRERGVGVVDFAILLIRQMCE